MDVPPCATAEWIHPRGRYRTSPGSNTASIRGAALGALGDRVPVIRPGLVGQRMPVHRLVDGPVLRARDLDHEHVVRVVVRIEPARGRGGDVGVHLGGVAEVRDQLPGERRDRLPCAVQALEDERRTAGELLQHLARVELIADLGAEAARTGERVRRKYRALGGHAHERRAQRAVGDELVRSARAEEIVEVRRGRRAEKRPLSPMAVGEVGRREAGRRASAGRSLGPRSAASFKRIRRRRRRDPPRWLRRLRVLRRVGGSVRAAVVAAGVRAAVRRSLAGVCGTVRAAVVAARIGAAVSGSLAAARRAVW